MEKENTYTIYTDASFDDFTKIGTYSIIIMQSNSVLKRIARKCKMQMNNSTECEIFAVYQAINIILSVYLKNNKQQKFKIRTDSIDAKNFFDKRQNNLKIFVDKTELIDIMRKTYNKVCKKVSKRNGSFSLIWIPREANKMAHKWSYTAFQKLRGYSEKKEILLINKDSFFKLLLNGEKTQNEIIKYLFSNSDEQKLILKTQKEISNSLNIPISIVNKSINNLIKLDVLEKVKNGKYEILL